MTQNVIDEIQDWVKGQGLDVELLVDVSGSMKNENRLAQAMEFARAAAQVAALVDEDGGIGLTFFSDYPADKDQTFEDLKVVDIQEKFDNARIGGSTDTLKFLENEIAQHYDRKTAKADQKTLIVCITDGEPVGGKAEMQKIKATLAEFQKQVDWTQRVPELKVLFYQVGTDAAAKTFLKDLDDDNDTCGMLVESVFEGKDSRSVNEIFRDALREHIQN
jgi:uncharacterized protein YegL